ncbi:MAG: GTP-binding protein [Candidatus Helarchaeota archaeon]
MRTLGFKCVTIGEPAVGKTSLVRRFTTGKFSESYLKTIGADFTIKYLDYPDKDMRVLLQIWDIAGDVKFKWIRPDYYAEAQGAIMVYDITREETFKELDEWLENLRTYCGDIPCILLANKTDLEDKRKVTKEMGEDYGKKRNLPFFETSALSGQNVEEAFKLLSDKILEKS